MADQYRAGNYVYFDRTQVGLGAATLDDCALTVLATVISKWSAGGHPHSGAKTLAATGRAALPAWPVTAPSSATSRARAIRTDDRGTALEEQRRFAWRAGASLEPGDRVRLVPNHSCVVSNLFDRAWIWMRARSWASCRSRLVGES
jgi:D-serine deaminase-like pyridoxal phosphate-dependent protein